MSIKDERVDEYISKAQPFAKPILKHLRKLVHKANPEVEETIKWSFAAFNYKGLYCSMASFKEHVSFGFWKTSLLKDPKKVLQKRAMQGGEAMGNFGRIASLKDLPPDNVIIDLLVQAKKLNDDNIKVKRDTKTKKALIIPDYFLVELKKNRKANSHFEKFTESMKREYIDWITEAKTEKTRLSRMSTSIEWISEGKIRNWKYVK